MSTSLPARARTALVPFTCLLAAAAVACGSSQSGTTTAGTALPTSTTEAAGADEFFCIAGTPGTTTPGTPLTATLQEYSIQLSRPAVPAGTVALGIDAGAAKVEHEVLILHGSDPAAFPTDEHGGIDEDKLAAGTIAGEVEKIKPGSSCTVPFDLRAGDYLVVCNFTEDDQGTVPGVNHFHKGMVVPLTVS